MKMRISDIANVNELSVDKSYPHESIRYIDIASVDRGKILETSELNLSESPSRARRIVRHNDILLSTVRPNLKHFCFIRNPEPNTIASTGFAVISVKKADPYYVYCLLTTERYTEYLSAIADSHTSAYPAFNPDIIMDSEFELPPIEQQQVVSSILLGIDDKIELNRKMNETLEAIAKAIFKSWFVDFDPVHAKMAGKKPVGMDDSTAALFPDSFDDSELGEIPRGWFIGIAEDNFNITMGQSPPGATYNEDGNGIPFHQGCTDYGWRFPSSRMYCTDPRRYAKQFDTLVSVRAPVGALNMANKNLCIGRGLSAVRHKSGCPSYTYYSMIQLKSEFENYEANGTVFGCIGKAEFGSLKLLIPPDNIISAFSDTVRGIDNLIYNNENEGISLREIRDLLLPKLISGEIEVVNNYEN